MSRAATDGLYIELGYLTPEEYYAYVAEAQGVLENYIEPNYIELDYYEGQGAFATVSCELTLVVGTVQEASASLTATASVSASAGKIVEANIALEGFAVASLSALVSKNGSTDLLGSFFTAIEAERSRDTDVTLSTLINLSLQSARTRPFDSALSASFAESGTAAVTRTTSSSLAADFASTASIEGTLEGAATLSSSATLSADVEAFTYINAEASLNSAFTQTANAIEYRANDWSPRPVDWSTRSGTSFNDSIKKHGTHSVRLIDQSNLDQFGYLYSESISGYFNIDLNEDFAIEFWVYMPSGSTPTRDWFLYGLNNTNFRIGNIYSSSFQNNQFVLKFYGQTLTSASYNTNQWIHISVSRASNVVRFKVNNSTVGSFTDSRAITPTTPYIVFRPQGIASSTMYIDSFALRVGESTVNGYSAAPTNTEGTLMLTHFDNVYTDDITNFLLSGSAALTSSFTQTASAGLLADSIALEAGSFALTVDANVIQQGAAGLDAAATLDAQPGYLIDGDATLQAFVVELAAINKIGSSLIDIEMSAILSADVNEIVQLNSDLTAVASQNADASKIAVIQSDLLSEYTLAVDTSGIRQTNAIFDGAFAQTATAVKTVDTAVDLASSFTQTASGIKAVEAEAGLDSTTALEVDNDRIRNVRIGYAGDRTPKVVSTYGNVEISTAQSKFGSGSALITDTGDYFTVPGDSNLYNGNFTVEMWVWATNLTQMPNGTIWDNRTSSSNGFYLYVSYGSIGLYEGITGKGLTSAGFNNSQWNHIAVVRNGTNIKVFVNGVQKISATVTTTNYSNRTSYISSTYAGAVPFRAYIDEVRLSDSARYTGAFTPATTAFTSDGDVRALLHLDTDFSDDVGYAPGLEAFASTLAAVATVGDFLITLESAATMTVDAVIKTGSVIGLDSSTALEATPEVTRTFDSSLNSQFDITIDGTTNIVGEAALEGAATLEIDAVKTVDAEITISGAMTFQSTVNATRNEEIALYAISTMNVGGNVIRGNSVALEANFTQTTVGSRVRYAAATLSGAFTTTAEGRIIIITQYVYVVPSENRTYIIPDENRTHRVAFEERTYTVRG